jgi:hypothetical protein
VGFVNAPETGVLFAPGSPIWVLPMALVAGKRPLTQRMRYAFIHTYKPVLDDAPFRAWDSTAQYRSWCESNLPDWLGYGRV